MKTALAGGRLIDGRCGAPISQSEVLIEGARITAVGTLSAWKFADIIAVKGDVLCYADLLQRVDVAVKHGQRVKYATPRARLPRVKTKKPGSFEPGWR